jgi:hypothetical protein
MSSAYRPEIETATKREAIIGVLSRKKLDYCNKLAP